MKSLSMPSLLLSFLLTGCGSNEVRKDDNQCSCASYFSAQKKPTKRPSWVDTEGLKRQVYYSQGIAQCTGLKTIDVKKSATNARANLSRMLESQVETEINLIRHSNSAINSGSESGQTNTSIASETLLKNSSIYDYWVDPNSCTIYSAVRLSKIDIDRTVAEAKEKEQSKLKNQRFVVQAEGEYQHSLQLSMLKVLSAYGVNQIISREVEYREDEADYSLHAKIQSVDLFAEKKLVRVVVFVSIRSVGDGRILWSAQLRGKSISLQNFQQEYQIRQALADSFKQGKRQMQAILEKKPAR